MVKSAKNPKSKPSDDFVTTKFHRYRVEATKSNGKYVLRRGFLVTELRTTNKGVLVTASSDSRALSQLELADVAKKLSWEYKKSVKIYHLDMDKHLKITSGYVTLNYQKIKDIKV